MDAFLGLSQGYGQSHLVFYLLRAFVFHQTSEVSLGIRDWAGERVPRA